MRLDHYQAALVERIRASKHGPDLRVDAVAGSGKTATLVQAIPAAIEAGWPASRIWCCTFTSAAGQNLRDRVSRYLPAQQVRQLQISTFHGLALRWLGSPAGRKSPYSGDKLGHHWNVGRYCASVAKHQSAVPSTRTIWSRVTGSWRRLWDLQDEHGRPLAGLDLPSDAYETYPDRLEHLLLSFPGGTDPDGWTRAAAAEQGDPDFENAVDLYLTVLRGLRAFTFTDCLTHWLCALEGGYELGANFVIMDEAQDTNALQHALARTLAGPTGRLVYVGDWCQSIYGFQGADPSLFLGLGALSGSFGVSDDREVESLPLARCYRSTDVVVGESNRIRELAGSDVRSESARGPGGSVEYVKSEHGDGYTLAEHLVSLSGRHEWRDMAVLARTNAELAELQVALDAHDVPCQVVGGSFWTSWACTQLMSLLALTEGLDSVSRLGDAKDLLVKSFMKREELEQSVSYLMSEHRETLVAALARFGRSNRRRQHFSELAKWLRRMQRLPWQKRILRLAEPMGDRELRGIIPPPGDTADAKATGVTESRMAFLRTAYRFPDFASFAQYVQLMAERAARFDPKLDKVTICTIHRAKGLEWGVVGVATTKLPHDKADRDEEIRLAYVAVSRAKDHLVVAYHERPSAILLPEWSQVATVGGSSTLPTLPATQEASDA